MPLAERVVEPSNLGAQPLNVKEKDEGKVHNKVATNCLIGALYQLASLVRHADDIFCDISDECRKVLERTHNINKKIDHIQHHVDKLDAKEVQIPIGDLSTYSRVDDHHTAKHGFEINLFTDDSRPHCIADRYHTGNPTPAGKLRGADLYRKDGLHTENLFSICPVVLNEHKVRTPDLNLPRKLQSVFTFEKKYKRLKKRPKTITSLDELYKDDEKKEKEGETPYDVPQFPPYEKVSIDTTGKGFQQMESFRQALVHIEREDTKKRKKRKSISGVPEDILKEIEKFEKKRRSTSGHDVCDYLFEDAVDPVDHVERDEQMAKYLDEIDAKIEDRMEEEVLMKERKIMKFLPCRRSKSLPRCVRLYKPNEKRQSIVGSINAQEGSCLSLASNGTCASRISRSTKRSSIISNKLKILVNGNSKSPSGEKPRPRPKSLDLDAIDFNEEMSRSNLAQTKMPSMPDGVFNNTTAEMRKNIGPGSYYTFESNTLPRRRCKRSESPWEYLPKDWTSSVKLREINKGRAKEDRQSSSGHWSGTNSNRHSLDSDNVKSDYIPHKTSQISLGQDSGRGSPLPEDERGSTDTNGGYIGDTGSTVTDGISVQEVKLDSDAWIQSLAIRALKRDEVSTSSAETLNSLTKLTKQNIEALDLMMSPSRRKQLMTMEDEQCSEYSVDQEGFYTSFHNDSGLRKSSATLVDEEDFDLSQSKDSHSVCSFDSVIHNPDSEKFAGIKKNPNSKSLNKVTPPLPPKRTCSISSMTSNKESKNVSAALFGRQDSLFSDTDQETFFKRVEDKSKISANGIPSLISLTSDDDSILEKGDNSSPDSSKLDVNQHCANPAKVEHSSVSQFSLDKKDSSSMDGISVFTINSDESTFDFGNSESHDCKTMPRNGVQTSLTKSSDSEYKSWPRSHKQETSILASILNSNDTAGRPQKSLYQCPTSEPKTASKEELEKMGDNSSYKLSVPISHKSADEAKTDIPTKYHPVLVVKPGVGKSAPANQTNAINDNMGGESKTVISNVSGFALTGNPKSVPSCSSYDTSQVDVNSTAFSSFSGSMSSVNSELSMADSFTIVSRTSNCSSPNLSNMDIPAVLTPTGSVDSLTEPNKTFSNTIDNSNLSSTMETIAITTNTVSLNSTKDETQKSFRTFSGEMIPEPSMFTTSTPYTSSNGMQYHDQVNYFQESPVSYSNKHSSDQRTLHTSQSFPSNLRSGQRPMTESKRHSFGGKAHPVVNVSQMNDSNNSSAGSQMSRTDSYRVAMGNTSRSGSYRIAMNDEGGNYPSYNISNRRSTTPRVNLTNQMITDGLQPTHQPTVSVQSNDHGGQGQARSSGAGKGRYNPIYATSSVATGRPNDFGTDQKLTVNHKTHNRRSLDSQLPLSHNQKTPSPSLGRHQSKQPSPNVSRHQRSQVNDGVSVKQELSRGNTNQIHSSKSASQLNQNDLRRQNRPPNLHDNNSAPNLNDNVRTDSYRVAMGTNYDNPARNSSYRVAVKDTDPLIRDSRLDAIESMTSSGRDSRRMGITNIDQVQSSLPESSSDPKKQQVVRRRKPDVDPISVLSNRETNTGKTNKNRFSTSSTFIQFDPISEDWEFMMNSSDTMSNFSAGSDRELLEHGDIMARDSSKVNAMSGSKVTEKNSSSSLLGSIKSTLKSMSGKQPKDTFDDGRYSFV